MARKVFVSYIEKQKKKRTERKNKNIIKNKNG